jgi:hypothetical protein
VIARIKTTDPAILEALFLQAMGAWYSLGRLGGRSGKTAEPVASALLKALCASPLEEPEKAWGALAELANLDCTAAAALAISRTQIALAQEQLLVGDRSNARNNLSQALANSMNAVSSTGMPTPPHMQEQLLSQVDELESTLNSQLDLAMACMRQALPAQLVLVLGMHRSGTSALSGLLVQAGLDAPKDLMPASPANPRGYWESLGAMKLNDKLLQQLGTHWSTCWGLVHHDWKTKISAVHAWRSELLELLRTAYPQGGIAVLKDPRLCALLPALQPWIESNLFRCIAFLPIRHPAEVAGSLRLAEGIPHGQALLLWLGHVLSAERYSRPIHRVIVDFNQLLTDPQAVLNQSAPFLNLDDGILDLHTSCNLQVACGFIDPHLQHQRASEEVPSWVMDEQVETLYELAIKVHSAMVKPMINERKRLAKLDQFWRQWLILSPPQEYP